MPTSNLCEECGAELRGDGPAGVCTRCLFHLGLDGAAQVTWPGCVAAPSENAVGAASLAADGVVDNPGTLRRLGDYEILEEIGRGGMGVVFRARQVSLDRVVALKMILAGSFGSREQAVRLRLEAEAVAKLQHPNIVRIYETGEHEGQPFFSMDYLEGGDLGTLGRVQRPPIRRAAGWVKTISEAIEYAHGRGILHRDLKPSNILLDRGGEPRITDFGLARRVDTEFHLTVTGQVMGSPNFMPPEQASPKRGKSGPASDVYGLGGVLFFLLTGRPPFLGETVVETLRQVTDTEAISPRLLNPEVPRDLATICLKCLEKDPERRYRTAGDLAAELGRYLGDESIQARPSGWMEQGWRWCRRHPTVAVLGAAILLLLASILIGAPAAAFRIDRERRRAEAEAQRNREAAYAADVLGAQRAIEEGEWKTAREHLENQRPRAGIEDRRSFEWYYLWQLLKGEELASWPADGGVPRWISMSSDGRWVAASGAIFETQQGQVVGRLANGRSALVFEPKGSHLMVAATNGIYRLDVLTGGEQFLPMVGPIWAAAFSSSGRWFAAGGEDGLNLWDAQSWQRVAGRADLTFNFFTARGIAFAPDDSRMLVNTGNPLRENGELRELGLPSLRSLGLAWGDARNVACMEFSKDGGELLTGGWDGRVLLRDLRERNRPVREIAHLLGWIADAHYELGSSRILVAGADRFLRFLDKDKKAPGRGLRGHAGEIWAMAPSPEGSNVFTLGSDRIVKKWSANLPESPDLLKPNPAPIHPIGLKPDGRGLATRSAGRLSIWRWEGRELHEDPARRIEIPELRPVPADPLRGQGMVVAAPDLETYALALRYRPVEVWSWHDRAGRKLPGTASKEPLVGYSPDGRLLVIARDERHLGFWDTRTLRAVGEVAIWIPNQGRWPWAFASKTNVMAVAADREVTLWRTDPIRKVGRISTGPFKAMALSPDASLLVVGWVDGTIRIFDVASGQAKGPPVQGHLTSVDALAFSGDGQTLVSGGDQRVKFREMTRLRELSVGRHSGPVIFAMFSANDEMLVTADAGLSVRIWPAPRGDSEGTGGSVPGTGAD